MERFRLQSVRHIKNGKRRRICTRIEPSRRVYLGLPGAIDSFRRRRSADPETCFVHERASVRLAQLMRRS